MPPRNMGERQSMNAEEGLDQQGYVLTEGTTAHDVVKTSSATDSVLGINYTSTMNADDTEVQSDVEVPVIHDGYPLVLVEPGFVYDSGTTVYVASPANSTTGSNGAASANADPAGDGSITPNKIGNVPPGYSFDRTGESGLALVPVDVTNNLGDA